MIHAFTLAAAVNGAMLAPQRHGAIAPATSETATFVYAADAANDAIYGYTNLYTNLPDSTPQIVITQGIEISGGGGMAVDRQGNLYVANINKNYVEEFAPGHVLPNRVYSKGLAGPTGVAVDSSGDVYVSNYGFGQTPRIVMYAPGGSTPSQTWQSPYANSTLGGIALATPDYAGGDAYVSYGIAGVGSGILYCLQGTPTCLDMGLRFPNLGAIALQYNTFPLALLVAGGAFNGVDLFHIRHGRTPTVLSFGADPEGIAFDPGFTHLFVASGGYNGTNRVNEYDYATGTIEKSFLPPKNTKLTPVIVDTAVYPSANY